MNIKQKKISAGRVILFFSVFFTIFLGLNIELSYAVPVDNWDCIDEPENDRWYCEDKECDGLRKEFYQAYYCSFDIFGPDDPPGSDERNFCDLFFERSFSCCPVDTTSPTGVRCFTDQRCEQGSNNIITTEYYCDQSENKCDDDGKEHFEVNCAAGTPRTPACELTAQGLVGPYSCGGNNGSSIVRNQVIGICDEGPHPARCVLDQLPPVPTGTECDINPPLQSFQYISGNLTCTMQIDHGNFCFQLIPPCGVASCKMPTIVLGCVPTQPGDECPTGQSRPTFRCENGQCKLFDECGVTDCSTCGGEPKCPAGQTFPHVKCVNGACTSVNACGANNCDTCFCPVEPGEPKRSNPHSICDNGQCVEVADCGVSDCSTCPPPCPAGESNPHLECRYLGGNEIRWWEVNRCGYWQNWANSCSCTLVNTCGISNCESCQEPPPGECPPGQSRGSYCHAGQCIQGDCSSNPVNNCSQCSCPIPGQTNPHIASVNGECVIADTCGYNNNECDCPPGQIYPHFKDFGNGVCQLANECGTDECTPACFDPPDPYWTLKTPNHSICQNGQCIEQGVCGITDCKACDPNDIDTKPKALNLNVTDLGCWKLPEPGWGSNTRALNFHWDFHDDDIGDTQVGWELQILEYIDHIPDESEWSNSQYSKYQVGTSNNVFVKVIDEIGGPGANELAFATSYFWRVRVKSNHNGTEKWSDWHHYAPDPNSEFNVYLTPYGPPPMVLFDGAVNQSNPQRVDIEDKSMCWIMQSHNIVPCKDLPLNFQQNPYPYDASYYRWTFSPNFFFFSTPPYNTKGDIFYVFPEADNDKEKIVNLRVTHSRYPVGQTLSPDSVFCDYLYNFSSTNKSNLPNYREISPF